MFKILFIIVLYYILSIDSLVDFLVYYKININGKRSKVAIHVALIWSNNKKIPIKKEYRKVNGIVQNIYGLKI